MKVRPTGAYLLYVAELVTHIAVGVTQTYDRTDPVVRAHPWAFEPDGVEQATAAPGEKRAAKK